MHIRTNTLGGIAAQFEFPNGYTLSIALLFGNTDVAYWPTHSMDILDMVRIGEAPITDQIIASTFATVSAFPIWQTRLDG